LDKENYVIQKRAQIPKIDYDLYTGVTVVPLSEMISTHGSVLHIETQPWQAYRVPSTSVYARVSIAYRNTNIYLVFDVFEQQILAEKHMHNQMVCEDSCVEMFLSCSPDSRDKSYVNFEFNPLGRCYAGTGTDRNDRTLFPPQLIETIT
jgi:hypothetical protein